MTYQIKFLNALLLFISLCFFQKNEIDDLPPGGFPLYLTEVNAPGPAYGL
jgi:hypothetical protein